MLPRVQFGTHSWITVEIDLKMEQSSILMCKAVKDTMNWRQYSSYNLKYWQTGSMCDF